MIKQNLVGQTVTAKNERRWKYRVSTTLEVWVTEGKGHSSLIYFNLTQLQGMSDVLRTRIKAEKKSSLEQCFSVVNELNLKETRRLNNLRKAS